MPESTESTRVRRTPAQIAQDELDKADARVERATKREASAREELSTATDELKRAKAFREYVSQNPDLPTEAKDAGDVALASMTGNTEDPENAASGN